MFPRTVSRANSRHHLRAQCAIPQARVLAKPSVRRMLVMVMGIARCVLHACVATCARRPMRVFARCTACAMQARFARCAKWRSGPGPILLRSCARTLRSTRAIFFAYHSQHSSHRTGSPDAPGPPPPPDTCSRGGRPSRASYIIFAYYSHHSSHRTLFFTYYSYHL